jgi:hypothetical protein
MTRRSKKERRESLWFNHCEVVRGRGASRVSLDDQAWQKGERRVAVV